MNVVQGLKHWDERFHRFEHNAAISTEKMIHSEAFWAAVVVTLLIITLILVIVFVHNGGMRNTNPTPFGPYPYY